jgi:exopolysaccharide biosynthesis polyprenyl glycosylphosphotransferase
MVVDAGLFALGFYLAHAIRYRWPFEIFGGTREIYDFSYYVWVYLLIIPLAPLALQLAGFYQRSWLPSRLQTGICLLRACGGLVVALVLMLWVMRETLGIARSVLILFGLNSFVLVFLKEELLLRWRHSRLGRSQTKRRLVLVGTPIETRQVLADMKHDVEGEYDVVASLDLNEQPVERLVEIMHEHSPNGIIMAAQHTYFGQIEQAISVCEREGVEVWLLADFFKPQISQTSVAIFQGRPTLVFRSVPSSTWPLVAKQAVDFFGALVLLMLAFPVMVFAAAGIKLTSRGPVLFRQERSGLNGRPFTMLKFRSMVTDAEQRKHELAALNEMSGPVFKVTNDPRITPFGRFLRKYSIDELPQLLNVLFGEMSLVGPRPLPVAEVRRFDDPAHRRRLSVKPGLTCLWQVSGRSQLKDFKEWVRLDLEYIDNWSLSLDFKILLMTVPVVFSGSGAK